MQDENEVQAKSLADLKASTARDLAAPDQRIDLFSQRGFALAQRLAQALSTSDAVPAIFQAQTAKKEKGVVVAWVENPAAFGNCLIAIETAQAVGMSITAVMQNANIIEGKLSWSGKFIIAAVNASRRFTPLRFDVQNLGMMKATYKEKDGWNNDKKKWNMIEHTVEIENEVCRAWALPYGVDLPRGVNTLAQAEAAGLPVIKGPKVSMKLAVEEGWYAKPGSKWQTDMKDLMMTYRAGAYFGNIHAPDVVMGMGRSTEERQDEQTIDVERQPDGRYAASASTLDEMRAAAPAQREDKHPGAETVEVTEKAKPAADDIVPEPSKAEVDQQTSKAYEALMIELQKARTLDQLAEACDLIKNIDNGSLRDALMKLYRERYAEFKEPEQSAPAADAPVKRARRSTAAPE